MSRRSRWALTGAAGAVALGALAAGPALATGPSTVPDVFATVRNLHVCGLPTSTAVACGAIIHETVDAHGRAKPAAATPSGYGPADLQSAYRLPSSTAGAGQTVAIVDAYNDPNAAADLAGYRSTYGQPACTTASGCLRIVNQNGGSRLPAPNGGWAQEISLDLDMVSATCPNCHILLVEANSPTLSNLGTSVDTAVRLGATQVSNSYGGGESPSDLAYDQAYFNHPGVTITASTGDNGYGVGYPASSSYVTAVGGTSLTRSSAPRGWSESAWSGAGSGCSAYDGQPSWQSSVSNITTYCSARAVADVSAVADPNTGVAVYDSYTYQGQGGWLVFGGTSASAPIIASVYAMAGNSRSTTYGSYPYSHTSALNDVTSGSNTLLCTAGTLCNSTTGWDGPTGLGTPNGVGGF